MGVDNPLENKNYSIILFSVDWTETGESYIYHAICSCVAWPLS